MRAEIIGSRGHTIDLSEEWAALGHLSSFVEGVIVSRDLINFNMELDIENKAAGIGPENYTITFSSRTGLSLNYLKCQQFTANADITDLALPIFRENAATQNAIVQIRELVLDPTSGLYVPTGSVLAEIIIAPGDVGQYVWSAPMTIPWIQWSLPVTLEKSKMYGIYAYSLESSSTIWKWALQTGLFYGGVGDFVYSNNGGASWSTYGGYDLTFRLWESSWSYIDSDVYNLEMAREVEQDVILEGLVNDMNLVLDQLNDAPVTVQDGSGNSKLAQTFVPAVSGRLGRVDVYNRRAFSNTTISIYDTVGGLPNNRIAGPFYPSFADSGQTIPNYHWSTYYVDCDILSGTMYAIVIENADIWVCTRNNPYPNGAPYLWWTDHWELDWIMFNDDYCFKTYTDIGEGCSIEIEKELELIPDEPEFYLEINSIVDFELELINEEEP